MLDFTSPNRFGARNAFLTALDPAVLSIPFDEDFVLSMSSLFAIFR